jgi:hypothetical protein
VHRCDIAKNAVNFVSEYVLLLVSYICQMRPCFKFHLINIYFKEVGFDQVKRFV